MKKQSNLKEIRALARRFSPEELERCIQQQIQEGENVCEISGPTEYVVNELSKASVVKELMNEGISLSEAVRELARRIRQVQKSFDKTEDKAVH